MQNQYNAGPIIQAFFDIFADSVWYKIGCRHKKWNGITTSTKYYSRDWALYLLL